MSAAIKIFLDANILFSAAGFAGAVRLLLELLKAAGHECWADDYVIEEARRNLTAKRPAGLPVLDELVAQISVAPRAQPHAAMEPATNVLPEKDRPVLAAAMRSGCDALVTGDRRHFGPFYGKILGGIAIHSPASLIDALFPG